VLSSVPLETLGKYKIIGKIGQGAMGEVYKAHDAALNRHVAIKTIVADLGGDDTLRKRFEREAQSAAGLNHPNIIKVYDFGEQDDKLYMAMELLEGIDLRQAIDRGSFASLDEKLDVMEQVCEGLAFAHAHEIVHRDLKPANIHILPGPKVRIMDFGLARPSGSEMTRAGLVMGTPHYMSPEQVRGERATARSDVFAIGCVFYELLTLRKPFEADSMHAVLYKVMQEVPRPTHETPGIPAALGQVVDKALAKNPDQRYQNAGELKTALRHAREAIAGGQRERHRAAPSPERPPATAASLRELERVAGGVRPSEPTLRPQAGAPTPPQQPRLSRAPLYAGGAFAVVLVLAGVLYFLSRWAAAPPPPAPTAPGQVESLARAVADTQVELARKRLEAGDHAEAARQAERALKLDPGNAEARRILDRARKTAGEVAAAAAAAKAAAKGGDAEVAAGALWRLLRLAPDHPLVAELSPHVEGAFKDRAEEARRSMASARKAADAAGAGQDPAFEEASALSREGDKAVEAHQFATGARAWLKAQDRFELAVRSAAPSR